MLRMAKPAIWQCPILVGTYVLRLSACILFLSPAFYTKLKSHGSKYVYYTDVQDAAYIYHERNIWKCCSILAFAFLKHSAPIICIYNSNIGEARFTEIT